MNSPRKILLIDQAADRKERIGMLKQSGYAVFPALKLEEARSRSIRGGYDLIVVNAEGQLQEALQFCDNLRTTCPEQPLLMCSQTANEVTERDYAVAAAPDALRQRVDAMLRQTPSSGGFANAA